MKFTTTVPIATAFAIWVGAAHADTFNDSIVQNLTDLGYEFIEIKNGPTQVKVEAIRGAEKLEVIYDRTTGKILKQERESALGDDDYGRSGLQIDTRRDDFLDDDEDDDDEDDDEDDDDDESDDDEDDDDEDDDESDDDEDDSDESDDDDDSDESDSDESDSDESDSDEDDD